MHKIGVMMFLLLLLNSLACGVATTTLTTGATTGITTGITAEEVASVGAAALVSTADLRLMSEGDTFEWTEHAEARHGEDALTARQFRDRGPCTDYKCNNDKRLRVCCASYLCSVTWYKYMGEELPLREDTVFWASYASVAQMKRNKGCQ